MTKTQTITSDDESVTIASKTDVSGNLQRMEQLRAAGHMNFGESRFVGEIPTVLIEQWCKEAGVKWEDHAARSEVVKRKILSGEFDKFRSDWRGRW